MSAITNKSGNTVSLALSVLHDIPTGDFALKGDAPFYVRNNTGDTMEVELVPYGNKEGESVKVNIPGYAELPLLVKKVINAPSGLQWGY